MFKVCTLACSKRQRNQWRSIPCSKLPSCHRRRSRHICSASWSCCNQYIPPLWCSCWQVEQGWWCQGWWSLEVGWLGEVGSMEDGRFLEKNNLKKIIKISGEIFFGEGLSTTYGFQLQFWLLRWKFRGWRKSPEVRQGWACSSWKYFEDFCRDLKWRLNQIVECTEKVESWLVFICKFLEHFFKWLTHGEKCDFLSHADKVRKRSLHLAGKFQN